MGWFDFLKKKKSATDDSETQGKQDASAQSSLGTVTVPDGHEVMFQSPSVEPSVARSRGGVIFANFGVAGDDPDAELTEILRGVTRLVDEPVDSPANLVNLNREVRLSELFAPADPAILQSRSPINWIFHEGSIASLTADPRRLQTLFQVMYTTINRAGQPVHQAAYVVDPPSPETTPFVSLLAGLGLVIRQPDDRSGTSVVMVEVKRPEGVILCQLAGKPYPADPMPDPYALNSNKELGKVAKTGEQAVAQFLEQQLVKLAERVGSAPNKLYIPLRAPKLRRIMLEMEDSRGKSGMEPILTELLSRNSAFVFMKNPNDRGMEVRSYGQAGSALPMFADVRCLQWAAQDLDKSPKSFQTAAIHPKSAIVMAAGGNVGIAICTYRDRKTPVYAVLPADMVQTIAKALTQSEAHE